jgi:hypothetical protein
MVHFSGLWKVTSVINYSEKTGLLQKILFLILILKMFPNSHLKVQKKSFLHILIEFIYDYYR